MLHQQQSEHFCRYTLHRLCLRITRVGWLARRRPRVCNASVARARVCGGHLHPIGCDSTYGPTQRLHQPAHELPLSPRGAPLAQCQPQLRAVLSKPACDDSPHALHVVPPAPPPPTRHALADAVVWGAPRSVPHVGIRARADSDDVLGSEQWRAAGAPAPPRRPRPARRRPSGAWLLTAREAAEGGADTRTTHVWPTRLRALHRVKARGGALESAAEPTKPAFRRHTYSLCVQGSDEHTSQHEKYRYVCTRLQCGWVATLRRRFTTSDKG